MSWGSLDAVFFLLADIIVLDEATQSDSLILDSVIWRLNE